MSLTKMITDLNDVENEILMYAADNDGEIPQTEEEKAERLRKLIHTKTHKYISLIKHKRLTNTITLLQSKITEFQALIKRLKKIENFIHKELHYALDGSTHPVIEENTVVGYVKPVVSFTHTIDDTQPIEPQYGTYILPAITWGELEELRAHCKDAPHLLRLCNDAKHKVTVSQLPDTHNAKKGIPHEKIRFTKTAPRKE